eukprot:COSAG04_NODE_998_length_8854_cov_3.254369_6_plen_47_part_00
MTGTKWAATPSGVTALPASMSDLRWLFVRSAVENLSSALSSNPEYE